MWVSMIGMDAAIAASAKTVPAAALRRVRRFTLVLYQLAKIKNVSRKGAKRTFFVFLCAFAAWRETLFPLDFTTSRGGFHERLSLCEKKYVGALSARPR